MAESAPNSPYRICSKGNRMKPTRTHHCSACGVCILAMDHQCRWISNCVGSYNYKYFFLFLLHTWSGIILNVAICAYSFILFTYSYTLPSLMTSFDLFCWTLPSLNSPIGNGMNWPTVKTATKKLI